MESNIIPLHPESNSDSPELDDETVPLPLTEAEILEFPYIETTQPIEEPGTIVNFVPKLDGRFYKIEEIQPGMMIKGWGIVTDIGAAQEYATRKNAAKEAGLDLWLAKLYGADIERIRELEDNLRQKSKYVERFARQAEELGLKPLKSQKKI